MTTPATTDEFDFDESQMKLTENDLLAMDQEFLKAVEERTQCVDTQESYDVFTFWFLIILLLVFVFFLVMGVVMVVKGRRRRYEYAMVGYRVQP